MKKNKIFHVRTSNTGPTTPVTVEFRKYQNPETLAVILMCANSRCINEPYAVITVNLVASPYGDVAYQDDTHAYIDTTNCPWAEAFLKENGIAKPCDIYGMSGYCTYPLYEFNKNSVTE